MRNTYKRQKMKEESETSIGTGNRLYTLLGTSAMETQPQLYVIRSVASRSILPTIMKIKEKDYRTTRPFLNRNHTYTRITLRHRISKATPSRPAYPQKKLEMTWDCGLSHCRPSNSDWRMALKLPAVFSRVFGLTSKRPNV